VSYPGIGRLSTSPEHGKCDVHANLPEPPEVSHGSDPGERGEPHEAPDPDRASDPRMRQRRELDDRPCRDPDHATEHSGSDQRVQPDPTTVADRPSRCAERRTDRTDRVALADPDHRRVGTERRVPLALEMTSSARNPEPQVQAVEVPGRREPARTNSRDRFSLRWIGRCCRRVSRRETADRQQPRDHRQFFDGDTRRCDLGRAGPSKRAGSTKPNCHPGRISE